MKIQSESVREFGGHQKLDGCPHFQSPQLRPLTLVPPHSWWYLPSKTCARTGLGSAVPASRLALRTSACNTSITWSGNIGQRNSFKQTSHFSIGKSWPVFRGSFLQPPCWRRPCVERWQRLSARSHHLCWPASWVDSRSTAWTRTPNQTCHALFTERERSH